MPDINTTEKKSSSMPAVDCRDCDSTGWITWYPALNPKNFPRNYRCYYSCKIPCLCDKGKYFMEQTDQNGVPRVYPSQRNVLAEKANVAIQQRFASLNADVWTHSYSKDDFKLDLGDFFNVNYD